MNNSATSLVNTEFPKSLFLINSHAWRNATLLERESKEKNRCFHVKFAYFLRTSSLKNIYERLLLEFLTIIPALKYTCLNYYVIWFLFITNL